VVTVQSTTQVDLPEEGAAPGSILLFDGIFLSRPDLQGRWDFFIVSSTT